MSTGTIALPEHTPVSPLALRLLFLLLVSAVAAQAQEGPGNPLRFDGGGDNVPVNHTPALNAFPLTITAWVKTAQNTSFPPIVAKMAAPFSNGWQVYLLNGNLRARYFADAASFLSGNNGGLVGGLDGGFIADDVFHHVAFTVGCDGRETLCRWCVARLLGNCFHGPSSLPPPAGRGWRGLRGRKGKSGSFSGSFLGTGPFVKADLASNSVPA